MRQPFRAMSPSYEHEYDDISFQLNHVKSITKKYKHSTIVMAGDFNAKNVLGFIQHR